MRPLLSDSFCESARASKGLGLIELGVLAALGVGHLLGYVPTNALLPTTFVMGWLSLWVRGIGWRGVGLVRPESWSRTILVGIAVGIAYQFWSIYVGGPIMERLIGAEPDVSGLREDIEGNLPVLLIYLVLAWVIAALIEELADRGYLMSRIAGLAGGSRGAWLIGLVLSSLFFGVGHFYQGGLAGVVGGFGAGLVFGGLYLLSGRNLWLPIIAHGTLDTVGLVFIYLGWFK